MTRFVGSTCSAIALAALAVAAQVPTPAPAQPPVASAVRQGKSVTLTGCVRPAEARMDRGGSTLTSPTLENARSPVQTYMLAHVTGQTPGDMPSASYALVTEANVDLAAHLNHRVEATGTISEVLERAGSTPAGSAPVAPPTMHVTAMKLIAGTCL